MTSKIDRFLSEQTLKTPYLVVDKDIVRRNYRAFRDRLPLAEIFYAVKANPAPEILNLLHEEGASFDAASLPEIEMCLATGATPDRIAYGNVIKKSADIAQAYAHGVRLYAFDSQVELAKLAAEAPKSKVFCRISVEGAGADWPLSRKFGCDLDMAVDLMATAQDCGLNPHGISFHVGSQQRNLEQWDLAIGRAALVFSDLRGRGIELKMLNIGGGVPVKYRGNGVPDVAQATDSIMSALTRHFGNDLPAIATEPGRIICADAGVLETEVVLISQKSYDDATRWVYLDVGKFSGLAETMDEAIRYPISTDYDGSPEGPVVLAGPTCDGADILYENSDYKLPLELKTGDRVRLLNTGAYTTTYASVGFNGIAPLKSHYI
ncbi:MAG: type III PLP-dependent enzyme [Rhodospirillaceae bacterium]|nr:type III PLP-dependent enzyme [Rhodospirillaceae bacterium]